MSSLVLTLDLDGPQEYAAIHGLGATADAPDVMYNAPLSRFVTLCQRLGAKGTLFVIGRDIDQHEGPAARVAQLARAGFEVGCHSYNHDYHLSRHPRPQIESEIRRAKGKLEKLTGQPVRGFRAPGYNLSPAVLDALESLGFTYDSSVLPSPAYYAAKAAVIASYKLDGRNSGAWLGPATMGLAPRTPYRPGYDPYRRGGRNILELPVATATRARLPVTGASLLMAPPPLRRMMLRSLGKLPVVVINLHAMDLVDPQADALSPALARRQPELRIPVGERMARLESMLLMLGRGRHMLTASEAVRLA